ncbi:MAG: S8 family serine peptidase [Acidimicrobiia bacterium]|nr:S8 family serine peptidase [Acidimicrobiia bacterium]
MSEPLPAFSDAFEPGRLAPVPRLDNDEPITRDWAIGGATGAGVKVAVIDSGIDADHPAVGGVDGAVIVEPDPDSEDGYRIVDGPHADLYGHGTACAAIIRSLAPDVELYSVRVLGERLTGKGWVFAAGLDWAVEAGIQVANLSLSTTNENHLSTFHELTDAAAFKQMMVVAAMSNEPKVSIPSEFSSVFSTAAIRTDDPYEIRYNRSGPAEWGARGVDMEVAWSGGSTIVATGNSFAAPHITGLVARILSKRPHLTTFQVKTVLAALATNAI